LEQAAAMPHAFASRPRSPERAPRGRGFSESAHSGYCSIGGRLPRALPAESLVHFTQDAAAEVISTSQEGQFHHRQIRLACQSGLAAAIVAETRANGSHDLPVGTRSD
jgi:hypothetical protein